MKKLKVLVAMLLFLAAGAFLLTNETVFEAEVTDATVIEDGVYIGGIDVSGMTVEEATETVYSYLEEIKAKSITLIAPKTNVKLSLEKMGVSAPVEAAIEEAASVGQSGNLIKRFKELKNLEKEPYVVEMGLTIDKEATAEILNNKSTQTNIKAINHGLKIQGGEFVYVAGQQGNEVDVVASVKELSKHVETDWELGVIEDDELTLVSIVTEPKGSEAELAEVRDLLGSFTTNYKSSGAGRAKNVENGAAKVHGTVLYPGDEFSFYEMVNPFTKENGYELAGSYLNGETVESFGGGICQVSTTLYNALLKAELEITQRFNHSMTVAYVDLAADAAIAGTYKDLRFRNNYDYPIYIEGVCKNRNITFNIYGKETRNPNRVVTYVSQMISENNPLTEYTFSEAVPAGTFRQTRSKHVGYVAELWKVVTVNGVEQERTRVNKSTYQASCRKVTLGIGGANEAQKAALREAVATGVDEYVQHVAANLGGIY